MKVTVGVNVSKLSLFFTDIAVKKLVFVIDIHVSYLTKMNKIYCSLLLITALFRWYHSIFYTNGIFWWNRKRLNGNEI
jgi:hypothetical protein